jgi:hypothetical protein
MPGCFKGRRGGGSGRTTQGLALGAPVTSPNASSRSRVVSWELDGHRIHHIDEGSAVKAGIRGRRTAITRKPEGARRLMSPSGRPR